MSSLCSILIMIAVLMIMVASAADPGLLSWYHGRHRRAQVQIHLKKKKNCTGHARSNLTLTLQVCTLTTSSTFLTAMN
ncbi:hypothetical protein SEVIR_1G204751v4 [Setaria viridis]